MHPGCTVLLCLAALPASGQTLLSGDAFETAAEGSTLVYGAAGEPYQIEEFLPDRRVRLSFFDGECVDGRWFPSGDNICFVYDGLDGVHCWTFYAGADGVPVAGNNEQGTSYMDVSVSDEPPLCLGPTPGV